MSFCNKEVSATIVKFGAMHYLIRNRQGDENTKKTNNEENNKLNKDKINKNTYHIGWN